MLIFEIIIEILKYFNYEVLKDTFKLIAFADLCS
jgi:hypothetical protein